MHGWMDRSTDGWVDGRMRQHAPGVCLSVYPSMHACMRIVIYRYLSAHPLVHPSFHQVVMGIVVWGVGGGGGGGGGGSCIGGDVGPMLLMLLMLMLVLVAPRREV